MTDLLKTIQDDLKCAMREKDKTRIEAIRLITAKIKQHEVDTRTAPADTDILAILEKMVKQGKEAANQFRQGDREEMAEKEEYEISVFQSYLPIQLTDQEIAELLNDAISSTSANGIQDMGKVMAYLKPKCQGKADIGNISQLVKARLAG